MSLPSHPIDDSLLEAYLDNALPPDQRQAFEERLRTDAALREQVALQQRIDGALGELFPVTPAGEQQVAAVAKQISASRPASLPFPQRWKWAAAAAVALAASAALWWAGNGRPVQPYFEPTPLAVVYRNTVRQGYEPYYECEDPERFAQVFATRQGQRLQLLDMPAGSRMLGLSYPGGLSRQTTAMLCDIEGRQVMVFVDRESADRPGADVVPDDEANLHVFRQLKDGLVFYEVTPFDEPRAIQYLVAE